MITQESITFIKTCVKRIHARTVTSPRGGKEGNQESCEGVALALFYFLKKRVELKLVKSEGMKHRCPYFL